MVTLLAAVRTFLVGGTIGAAVLGLVGAIEGAPRVPAPPPPLPEDARAAHHLLREVQRIRYSPGSIGELSATIDEINGFFRLIGRAHPELAGRARIDEGRVVLEASLPVPAGWVNVSATVPPYDDGVTFESVRLGGISLPPAAADALLRQALDWRLGDGAGTRMLEALPRMWIDGNAVRVAVDMGALPRGNLSRLTVGDVYGRPMPDHAEVAAYVTDFEAAVAAGRLPREGSFLPWLRALIDFAGTRATHDDPERELIAGFMALNYLCGSVHFVTVLTPRRAEGEAPLPAPSGACDRLTLRDRVDTRRHFLTAATIKMLSDRGPAVVAGEAKELFDMTGGNFDFTDITANNSGIRLATLLAATPPDGWPALGARMQADGDVVASLDGIPGEMSRAAFTARFGGVDSPAYAAMLAEIEARIDALPIHAAGRDG